MIELETFADYAKYVEFGFEPGPWLTVTQEMIDRFADATLDRNWYHVDTKRAHAELPDGKTIAHGLLTLSLVPGMAAQIARVKRHGRALNYGCDHVRYPAPVQAGARIRLHMRVVDAREQKGGIMIRRQFTMEIEGGDRPALVADMLTLTYS